MTPFHLEILLHYSYSNQPFERATASAHDEVARDLVKLGVLEVCGDGYQGNDKGRAWVDFMLKTPLPVQKWVLPE
jgi:hypothetical protein